MLVTALEIKRAMYLALVCFSFPVKTLMTLVYSSKTRTNYKLKAEDLFDFVICTLIGVWVYLDHTYSRRES